jgi:sRNA-binding carbon storage regulator CsrA
MLVLSLHASATDEQHPDDVTITVPPSAGETTIKLKVVDVRGSAGLARVAFDAPDAVLIFRRAVQARRTAEVVMASDPTESELRAAIAEKVRARRDGKAEAQAAARVDAEAAGRQRAAGRRQHKGRDFRGGNRR